MFRSTRRSSSGVATVPRAITTESNCYSLSESILLHKSETGRRTHSARRPMPTRILQLVCFQYGTSLHCNNTTPTPSVTVI
jgi:hypothetical protein